MGSRRRGRAAEGSPRHRLRSDRVLATAPSRAARYLQRPDTACRRFQRVARSAAMTTPLVHGADSWARWARGSGPPAWPDWCWPRPAPQPPRSDRWRSPRRARAVHRGQFVPLSATDPVGWFCQVRASDGRHSSVITGVVATPNGLLHSGWLVPRATRVRALDRDGRLRAIARAVRARAGPRGLPAARRTRPGAGLEDHSRTSSTSPRRWGISPAATRRAPAS